ncbi:MAG: arsenate reductase ArsC [Pseudomonadota bacterium]
MAKLYNVLFVCSGNSGRSIMAESVLSRLGHGKFAAYSAGSHPISRINPLALEQLALTGFPTEGFRSKSWLEFTQASSPPLDFVITVCDLAGAQSQPNWPGNPICLAWHFIAPGAMQGTDLQVRQAFADVLKEIRSAVDQFVLLPVGEVERGARVSMAEGITIERAAKPGSIH